MLCPQNLLHLQHDSTKAQTSPVPEGNLANTMGWQTHTRSQTDGAIQTPADPKVISQMFCIPNPDFWGFFCCFFSPNLTERKQSFRLLKTTALLPGKALYDSTSQSSQLSANPTREAKAELMPSRTRRTRNTLLLLYYSLEVWHTNQKLSCTTRDVVQAVVL